MDNNVIYDQTLSDPARRLERQVISAPSDSAYTVMQSGWAETGTGKASKHIDSGYTVNCNNYSPQHVPVQRIRFALFMLLLPYIPASKGSLGSGLTFYEGSLGSGLTFYVKCKTPFPIARLWTCSLTPEPGLSAHTINGDACAYFCRLVSARFETVVKI